MGSAETAGRGWEEAVRRIEARATARPNAIPSYYENWALRQRKEGDPAARAVLAQHLAWQRQGRFVAWEKRRAVALDGLEPQRRSEVPDQVLIMSQGVAEVLQWRGRALFKNVFDFALLPMLLAELRPATILEIGSGNGASATWLADLAALERIDCQIVSVDIAPVAQPHAGVLFLRADAHDLAAGLHTDWAAKGPRLVIEDAHVGVEAALAYLDTHLRAGDYLVIEDSLRKAPVISAFLASRPRCYAVDTRYTDFFGRNATSCCDSIFKKVK